jgi:hypothetical protein
MEVETSLVVRRYKGASWCTLSCYGMLGKGGSWGRSTDHALVLGAGQALQTG